MSVTPPQLQYSAISYSVKCVSVESERVLADVLALERSKHQPSVKRPDRQHDVKSTKFKHNRKANLTALTLNSPDFLELNKKRPPSLARRHTLEEQCKFYHRLHDRSNSLGDAGFPLNEDDYCESSDEISDEIVKSKKVYPFPPLPLVTTSDKPERAVSSLVDKLLLDIYGLPYGDRGRSETESTASSLRPRSCHIKIQKSRLQRKSKSELTSLVATLKEHIVQAGGLLIRQLRRRDYLLARHDKQCDFITAHLQAHSSKRSEDTRMKFSLTPQPGESGFNQWLDAMKMVARLNGGIPPEFRKRLWLTLAERHLEQRKIDWKQAEKLCFNEWSNPDDEELGIQIVKDLHRTGCSLFCGAAGRDNQAVLRRVLLGFARWNKTVGYCQGLNVLAALILQVMDRAEASAVKVMIYLIEGVLPEGYFADNLRGLSIDMAVFRDLLRAKLPKLSRHLEALQHDDKATGSSYEPPLTNVFTMQWFLTLFCHCLPQDGVLRVWDLIFLEGDEILLRTALAIWEGLSDRIMTVHSADEFYSIMGVLTREMLEFTDTNNLIKTIVNMGPLSGVTSLREKHRYNITPWARKLSDDDEDSDTEEDDKLAVTTAVLDRASSSISALQMLTPCSDRERLALDISTLKHQYAKLRERQRQAHIILSAACARQSMVPPPAAQAMNHLLVGKSALISAGKSRQLVLPPVGSASIKSSSTNNNYPRSPESQRAVTAERQSAGSNTLHWKDTKELKKVFRDKSDENHRAESRLHRKNDDDELIVADDSSSCDDDSSSSSSSSTPTELCDEPDRLSDLDSEEQSSTSDLQVAIATLETSDKSPPPFNSESVEPVCCPSTEAALQSFSTIAEKIRELSCDEPKPEQDPLTVVDDDSSCRLPIENVDSCCDVVESDNASPGNRESRSNDCETDDIRESSCNGSLLNGITSGEARDVDFLNVSSAPTETLNVGVASDNEATTISTKHLSLSMCHYDYNSSLGETIAYDDGSAQLTRSNEGETGELDDESIRKKTCDVEDVESSNNKLNLTHRWKFEELSSVDSSGKPRGQREKVNSGQFSASSDLDVDIATSDARMDSRSSSPVVVESLNFENMRAMFSSIDSDLKTIERDLWRDELAQSPTTPYKYNTYTAAESPRSISSIVAAVNNSPSSMDSSSTPNSSSAATTHKTAQSATNTPKSSFERSSPSPSPKFTVSVPSSSDSSYSPNNNNNNKTKSSITEKSIYSSELQSPVSTSSIRYVSNSSGNAAATAADELRCYQLNAASADTPSSQKIINASPFYPINNPSGQQNTPSPSLKSRQLTATDDKTESLLLSTKWRSSYSPSQSIISISSPKDAVAWKNDSFALVKTDDEGQVQQQRQPANVGRRCWSWRDDERRGGGSLGSSNRRCPMPLLKPSSSNDAIEANLSVKRSSDIFEDIRNLKAKESDSDAMREVDLVAKRTDSIRRDLVGLESRRQGTFQQGATATATTHAAGGYAAPPSPPRIANIDGNSSDSSILRTRIISAVGRDDDCLVEDSSKLGVWTKVKPRNGSGGGGGPPNGRRSSDMALKIIQENSAILQRILTCQAKKRLPDLEEISKEITISPINEEISKIFSPILEQMGLNESEINVELAKINLKGFSQMAAAASSVASGSEFDAKMSDELAKLSIIDDSEVINYMDIDDALSQDYLTTREAFIDRQINEELSRLGGSYEDRVTSAIASARLLRAHYAREERRRIAEVSCYRSRPRQQFTGDSSCRSDVPQVPSEYLLQNEKCEKYIENILPYINSAAATRPTTYDDNYGTTSTLTSISYSRRAPSSAVNCAEESVFYTRGTASTDQHQLDMRRSRLETKPFDSTLMQSPNAPLPPGDSATKTCPIGELPYCTNSAYATTAAGHHRYRSDYSARSSNLSKESLEFRVMKYDHRRAAATSSRDDMSVVTAAQQSEFGKFDSVSSPTAVGYYSRASLLLSTRPSGGQDTTTTTADSYSPRNYERGNYDATFYDKNSSIRAAAADYRNHTCSAVPNNHYAMSSLKSSSYLLSSSVVARSDERQISSHSADFLPAHAERSRIKTNGSSIDEISPRSSDYHCGDVIVSPTRSSPQFSPFPVSRNTGRKPRELGLRLGLYSPESLDQVPPLRRS